MTKSAGRDRPKQEQQVRTLADLARLAGVSSGTVSRALAGKSLVNAETRDRIQALAREHGFRPNQMASKLRTRKTGVIGIVVPLGHERHQQISDPFYLTLLGHLADELTANGYDLMLSRAIPDDTSEWLERMTGSGMVDGVIVVGQSDQFKTIERVAEQYFPMVAWGHCRPGQYHCAVGTDNILGGRIAAEHLIARGARSIAFLGSTTGLEVQIRYQGARQAAEEAGIPFIQFPVDLAEETMGPQIARALADCNADGLFAGSDLVGMSALRILHEMGRKVPHDVKVVGFDDLPLAAQTTPALTTIRQDIATGAKIIVEKLRARIAGEGTESLMLQPRLIERETTVTP